MSWVKSFIRAHPKASAAVGATAVAAAGYYGVPPTVTETALRLVFGG